MPHQTRKLSWSEQQSHRISTQISLRFIKILCASVPKLIHDVTGQRLNIFHLQFYRLTLSNLQSKISFLCIQPHYISSSVTIPKLHSEDAFSSLVGFPSYSLTETEGLVHLFRHICISLPLGAPLMITGAECVSVPTGPNNADLCMYG